MATADIFQPFWSNTATANTTTQPIAVSKPTPANNEFTVMVTNAGSVIVYVAAGNTTVTVNATAGFPILPGSKESIRVPANSEAVAVMAKTGTAEVYITTGRGE